MKIGIIGCGYVGSTVAYAVLFKKAATEIVLIDKNHKRALAEAADISHATPFSHAIDIYAGDYSDLKGAELVIIAAGVNQKPGETRLQLLGRNEAVLRQILPPLLENAPEAMILMTTNPVDVMTHLAAKLAEELGYNGHLVFGSGTTLDTARFRSLLSAKLGVAPQHVHGYVIGEHGDSEVLTWSIVDIGGLHLDDFVAAQKLTFTDADKEQIDEQVRRAAYVIIEGKGATYYGIGAAVANIVDVVAHGQKAILTICKPLKEVEGIADVTLSMPHLIHGKKRMMPLPLKLSQEERKALKQSASIIKKFLDDFKNGAS
ncbi:L-lactate dehydrogenase [Calditrichota bacterium GD2]